MKNMKIQIVMSGKPNLSFAKEGIEQYIKRTGAFSQIELVTIKEDKHYIKKLYRALEGTDVILCDENGKSISSEGLAKLLDIKIQESIKTLSFVIGPANGHVQEIREQYGQAISLSELTFPHDMAVLVLSEALYRALSILNNHPYHRA